MNERAIRGIGLGLRRGFAGELLGTSRRVDWLEIVPENWMFYGGAHRRLLSACAGRWPIVPHGISLDTGGPGPLDSTYLAALARLLVELGGPVWTDHVCYTALDGRPLHDLLPLPFTEEVVDNVARRCREATARVGRPLALENLASLARMPGGTLGEADFLLAILERSGAELLLDVNNVYVNSINHGFDARAFLDRMPLERVRYLHVGGHTRRGDVLHDVHATPVCDEVWALYRHTLARAGRLVPTLVEWDNDIPALDVLLGEVDRARAEAAAALGPAFVEAAP